MNDMKLQMIVTGNNSGLNTMLNQSDANVRRFTNSAASHFSKLQAHATRVWGAITGASAATKLIGIGVGVGGLKSVIDDNLAFERTLLKMKFNAQLTNKELAELRKQAMDLSKTSLNSPLEIAQMQMRLANAGLKMDAIRQLAPTVANAAQVFEAPAGEIADLVFDKITKMGIKNDRVPQMLDMLYFHATSGRFETMDMARQAPEFLNAGALVGLNNEKGLNLMGALTQRLMRNATVQNPSEVSTMVKHGLSHITDPHYVKGLAKVGVDVKAFFDDKGHFKGDGGVDGLIGLTKAMKHAGLDNPFKMGKAGFREQYTKQFWLEMMRSLDAKDTDTDPNLLKMMERGKEAMGSGQLAKNLTEIKEANFGKIKAAEIEVQKAKLSEGAQAVTGAVGSAAHMFSEHPGAAIAAGAIAMYGANMLKNRLLGGKGGALENAIGKVKGGVGLPVMVTNWPDSLRGPMKASERLRNLPGAAGAAGEGAAAGTATRAAVGGTLATAAGGLAIAAAPLAVAYGFKEWQSSRSGKEADMRRLTLENEQLTRRINVAKQSGDTALQARLERQRGEQQQRIAATQRELGIVPTGTVNPADKGPTPAVPPVKPNPAGKLSQAIRNEETPEAKSANAKRWQGEMEQLDRRIGTAKAGTDKDLLSKLEKERGELAAKLDSVIRELQQLNTRPVQVNLDSRPIVAAVNTSNGREARRQ